MARAHTNAGAVPRSVVQGPPARPSLYSHLHDPEEGRVAQPPVLLRKGPLVRLLLGPQRCGPGRGQKRRLGRRRFRCALLGFGAAAGEREREGGKKQ